MVRRFGPTERALHWVHAAGFLAMLATGLVLYLPVLSEAVARRNLVKNLHLGAALVWAVAILLVLALGDRRRLAAEWREVETLDADDRRWLRGRRAPQGRFNAGQKLNAALIGGLMLGMYGTGILLWYGERDTTYRFAGTVIVHDWATLILMVLVAGHLYLALLHPATRHALRGMTLGDVDEDWAREHHPKWVEREPAPDRD